MAIDLMRYDAAGTRVCAQLPFDRNSPAKLVPGYKFDAAWFGAAKDHLAAKVWHWPIIATPILLRAFPGITTRDPYVQAAIARATHLNAARAASVAWARTCHEPTSEAPVRAGDHRARGYQWGAVQRTLAGGGSRGLFHETGTGKTITAAELLSVMTRDADGLRVSVVVCPVTLIRAAWLPDLSSWFPDLPVVNLRALKKGKARELAVASCVAKHGRCVALTNYEAVRTDASVRRVMSGAYVVFDEASKMKTYKSALAVVGREIAATFRGCVLLSGTPAPNTNLEYWPLAKVLAPAAGYDPFPGGYTAFTKEFCDVTTPKRRNGQPVTWQPPPEMVDGEAVKSKPRPVVDFEFRDELSSRIHERLAPVCEWLKKDDCLDLPAKVFQRVLIDLAPASAATYAQMRDEMRAAILDKYATSEALESHAVNALSQMMKLREITAGFVPAYPAQWLGGGDGAKVLVPLGDEKIQWLIEHCEDTRDRIVYWTQFEFEAARIVKELEAARKNKDAWQLTCAKVTGQMTDDAMRAETFRRFVAGEFQILIAHPGVAQWGVSLPGVSQAAYGSMSYSLQEFAQSQDRIHGIGRGDANKHSTFYLLCARADGATTIDDECCDVLDGKREALDLVFAIERERRGRGFVPQDLGSKIDA